MVDSVYDDLALAFEDVVGVEPGVGVVGTLAARLHREDPQESVVTVRGTDGYLLRDADDALAFHIDWTDIIHMSHHGCLH